MEVEYEYFRQNHPDDLFELKERGEISEVEYFTRAVELGRSYQSIEKSFALYDILKFTETQKEIAISMLLASEDARKIRDGENYKSDEYYKGVVLSNEALQRQINFRLQDLEDNLRFLQEAQGAPENEE